MVKFENLLLSYYLLLPDNVQELPHNKLSKRNGAKSLSILFLSLCIERFELENIKLKPLR